MCLRWNAAAPHSVPTSAELPSPLMGHLWEHNLRTLDLLMNSNISLKEVENLTTRPV